MLALPLILVLCIITNHHDKDEAARKVETGPGVVECLDDGSCAPKALEVTALADQH